MSNDNGRYTCIIKQNILYNFIFTYVKCNSFTYIIILVTLWFITYILQSLFNTIIIIIILCGVIITKFQGQNNNILVSVYSITLYKYLDIYVLRFTYYDRPTYYTIYYTVDELFYLF